MARYQLFRTSPSLSGQVRLDIIVNKDPKTQTITGDDIHIVPINDNIDFNESNKRVTLRYSHLENIKNLYREIGNDFYNTDGEYSVHSWLYDAPVRLDPFSHTYMTGLKRMRYTRYDKQFSYMVPVWISEYTDFDKLSFVCHAGSEKRDVILSSFKLSPDICEYLQKYMDGSPDGKGVSDKLLNIDFQNMSSYVSGIQADTGQYMTRDTSYIMNFILKRERPMIETDSNILDLFRQNNMIAQQLLNLNFVFNFQDIAGAWPEYYLYNKRIGIWIDVQYDNNSLEYKDLYTNYQFIPKYNLSNGLYMQDNVLDHMRDYDCIDLVGVNKFTQPIFHWSLENNPDYIFNLYSGCAPVVGDDITLEGGSFGWVDISLYTADPWKMNWKWIKFKDCTNISEWYAEYDDAFTQKKYEKCFTKILNHSGSLAIGSNVFRKFYNDIDNDEWNLLWNILNEKEIWLSLVLRESEDSDYKLKIFESDDVIGIIIICNNLNNMVLYEMCHQENLLSYLESDIASDNPDISSDTIGLVIDIFHYIIGHGNVSNINLWDRWIRPNKVEFNNILDIYEENKIYLDQKSSEFKYVKPDTNTSRSYYSYLYRYSGNLVPYFINPDNPVFYNEFYRYYQWDNQRSDIMRKCSLLNKEKVDMVHPSIILGKDHEDIVSYFPWIKSGSYFYDDWNTDIAWGRDSSFWNLPPTIQFDIILSRELSYSEIEERIWEGFIQAIKDMSSSIDCPLYSAIIEHETEFKEFIYSNYSITQNFEYASLDNIEDIIYTVTYKLR